MPTDPTMHKKYIETMEKEKIVKIDKIEIHNYDCHIIHH